MIKNLVLSGGGVRGIGFVGALFQLSDKITHLERICGTSAGAIVAVLYAVGFTINELSEIMKRFDFVSLLDEPDTKKSTTSKFLGLSSSDSSHSKYNSTINSLGLFTKGGARLIADAGLYDGQLFLDWIEGIIKEKTGIDYCTFAELAALSVDSSLKKYKELYIVASDLTNSRATYFSAEATPDVIISDAVRCSMSYPYVFKPHFRYEKVNGLRRIAKPETIYVDGGLLDNFALTLFDYVKYTDTHQQIDPDSIVINQETLGIKLENINDLDNNDDVDNKRQVSRSNLGMLALSLSMLTALKKQQSACFRERQHASRIITIDTLNISTLAFDLNDRQQQQLIASGKMAVAHYFGDSDAVLDDFMPKLDQERYNWDIVSDGDDFPEIKLK